MAALTTLGTVFELTPAGGGTWTEKVLHSFGSGADGTYPWAGLIFDAAGNLYGTTSGGGTWPVGRCSSCRPPGAGPGRSRCCITSAMARTGLLPKPA